MRNHQHEPANAADAQRTIIVDETGCERGFERREKRGSEKSTATIQPAEKRHITTLNAQSGAVLMNRSQSHGSARLSTT
jgi:hypothetical protein